MQMAVPDDRVLEYEQRSCNMLPVLGTNCWESTVDIDVNQGRRHRYIRLDCSALLRTKTSKDDR